MRLLTLIALAMAMAGLVVVATHASTGLEGSTQQALDIVVNILRTILDVIVDFIGAVLDEFVRAGKSFFQKS